jgi:phospholipid transport system substrate-binding protein
MITRRAILALALFAPFAARAQAPSGPAAPIADLNDKLLAVMRAGSGAPFNNRVRILQPAVQNAFDLSQILQNSIGPRWSSFPPQMQADLLEVFTQFTVATWVANFDSYDGQTFQILPAQRKVGSDEVVQTLIVPRAGEATRLDYVMRHRDSWKAVDILVDGSISRVAVQRSDFRGLVRQGDASALIASLRDKISNLAAGVKT